MMIAKSIINGAEKLILLVTAMSTLTILWHSFNIGLKAFNADSLQYQHSRKVTVTFPLYYQIKLILPKGCIQEEHYNAIRKIAYNRP
jgi:hypothetical protein